MHGFITVSGEKMSKSRGTGISPLRYLELGMNAEWLRYYIAAKLNARVEDIDFNPDDFVARVNSDLVGKYINIASRAAGFITKRFDGRLCDELDATGAALLDGLRSQVRCDRRALRRARVRQGAARDHAARRPGQRVCRPQQAVGAGEAVPTTRRALHQVCSTCIEAFRLLTIYLKPVLPALAAQVEGFLKVEPLQFADATRLLGAHAIGSYQHLMQRVDPKLLDALLEAPAPAQVAPPGGEALAPEIGIDDFGKIDLRIAKIVDCEPVAGSDKLLRLTLDVGEGRTRTVFSGIRSAYQPEQLVGKLTVMVANLARAQDEVRPERRHGAGGQPRRREEPAGHLHPRAG